MFACSPCPSSPLLFLREVISVKHVGFLPLGLESENHFSPVKTEQDRFLLYVYPCFRGPQEWSPEDERHSKVTFHIEDDEVNVDYCTTNPYGNVIQYSSSRTDG